MPHNWYAAPRRRRVNLPETAHPLGDQPRSKEFPRMSQRRGRHAAKRPVRRVVLLVIGLTFAAAAAALFGSSFIRVTPSAAHPDVATAELDAQRSGPADAVSRDHERSPQPPASPSASPSPTPSRSVAPIAGLSQVQWNNAAIIVDVARRRSLPRQAAVVAITTALQESNLYNVASGAVPASLKLPHEGESVNYDSIGLFQQRPSQGWGTVAQLMDPGTSTGLFYDRLLKVAGWQGMSVVNAAQAVQRSAYPGAYQKHEDTARRAVAALMP
jgi:hypothetical protein